MNTVHIKDLEWLTPDEIAIDLRVTTETVYKLIRTNKLRALKVEKQYRINQTDYKNYIERNYKE